MQRVRYDGNYIRKQCGLLIALILYAAGLNSPEAVQIYTLEGKWETRKKVVQYISDWGYQLRAFEQGITMKLDLIHMTRVTVLLVALVLSGCALVGNPVEPSGTQGDPAVGSEYGKQDQAHNMWGYWSIEIDPLTDKFEIVPVREAAFHANIRKFLEDGTPCSNCLKITKIVDGTSGTKLIDIQITHPFSGSNLYTGFDVRGIVMWNGSEVWPVSGLRTQDPDSLDGYVLNAGGYTTLFSPTFFPPGTDDPLFTYSKGKLATPQPPTSTLNPYIDYWTDVNRHMFHSGVAVTRTYEIRYPSGGAFRMGYAIDSCWDVPTTNPPESVPDDFPIKANRPEPYKVQCFQPAAIGAEVGSTGELQIRAYDWQLDAGNAFVECPELWDGKEFDVSNDPETDGTTFHVAIENEKGAVAGIYRALIGVQDGIAVEPPWDSTTYIFADIEVVEAPCCQSEPVASIYMPTDVITGQEVTLTSQSYDPDGSDCTLDLHWDLDGDDEYDDATGPEASTSWLLPGLHVVGLEAVDSCDLSDTYSTQVNVHVGVTLLEDQAFKEINSKHVFMSKELDVADAVSHVDILDKNGPWDFTKLPLIAADSYNVTLDKDNPEVAAFQDSFTSPYIHFYKTSGFYEMGDEDVDAQIYIAENYLHDPDILQWVGAFETYAFNLPMGFDPAIEVPFPLWVFTHVNYSVGFGDLYDFTYKVDGWGEGLVTIPKGGGQTARAVVLRYQSLANTPDHSVSLIAFQWVLDDGTVAAVVGAGNTEDVTQWDIETGEITGTASFNALLTDEPY
jgi:hypothetical protein